MDWKLRSPGAPTPASIDELGSRYLSSNGSLGLRGTLDEFGPAEKAAVTVNGLYDKAGPQWREPVNAPNGCFASLRCDGEELSARVSRLTAHEQSLDYKYGIQGRDTRFHARSGAQVRLRSSRFVSLASSRLICEEIRIEVDRGAELRLASGISSAIWDINGPHLGGFAAAESPGGHAGARPLLLSCRSFERSVALAVAELTEAAPGQACAIETALGPAGAFRHFSFRAEPGTEYLFRKYAVVADEAVTGALRCGDAAEACAAAARVGYAAWLERQRSAWDERWEACDVDIEGDEAAAIAIRFSMYQLLAIAPPLGSTLSIPARGLSGQMYRGAIFWDTEVFMLPFFLNGFPDIARTLVEYRIATLPGARAKADEYGHAGAFFAWESQEGGKDACTLFNVNDIIKNRPIRTFFRDRQIHISADVAYALWRYCLSTGEMGILLEGGAELVYECARFIVSWMYYKPGKDRYELLDVTGPDEYHERVHNDYFTNAICGYALKACAEMDALLKEADPASRSRIVSSIGMGTELDALPGIAAKLYLPKPDPESLVIQQFDGYGELEDIALGELLAKRLHPNEYLGGGDGLARWTRIIKQADVLLALALFSGDGEENLKIARANWDYYSPRTEHGSSLSASAHSLLAGRLGLAEEAYAYFMKTATADLSGEAKQYVGDLYIGGTHPAANGGAWLCLFSGICGIEAAGDSLRLRPALPAAWRSVSLAIGCGGRRIGARVAAASIRLEARGLAPGEAFALPLEVEAFGQERSWDGSHPITILAR